MANGFRCTIDDLAVASCAAIRKSHKLSLPNSGQNMLVTLPHTELAKFCPAPGIPRRVNTSVHLPLLRTECRAAKISTKT